MSAFLGKIHYWLYNKILLHESLIRSIAALAEQKGYQTEKLMIDSYGKYGVPVTGALEDYINLSNIHGWLQERIFSVEKRLAFIITKLLEEGIVKEDEITLVFRKSGSETGKMLDVQEYKPQELYTLIFDNMLEGMPCDNVNQILENTEDGIAWSAARCLHKIHWEEAGGNVDNFYSFRDSWIDGFLEALGTGYTYFRSQDGINTIKKG